MGEHQQQVTNKYQRMDLDELADHRLVRRAQAIVNLAGPRR